MSETIEKRYKILVVDDEQDNLDGFLRVFGGSFNLVPARSGKEALDILSDDPAIGVVVTDQRMEGMTGTVLLEAIKSMYPMVVRILITGYSDIKVTIDAINKGDVFRYIQKPIEKDSTLEVLCDALAKYAETLQIRDAIENTKKLIQQRFLQMYESVASGIAHYVSNGLVPAKTFISLMDQKVQALKSGQYDGEFFEGFLKQVISDMKRVESLIQMFLWVRNCKVEHFSNAAISELTDADGDEVKEVLERKKVRVEKKISKSLPPVVVDREKVREMISLLIKNSAAAAPEGSAVQVLADQTVDMDGLRYVRLKISHGGKGYSTMDVQRLFDPFYKFEEKLSLGINGLELTNCFIIALKHGCEIKVESRPGIQTSFIVDLPAIK